MNKLALIVVSLLTAGCASLSPPSDWTEKDTRREIFYAVALAADAYTTAQISRTPGAYEQNPAVSAFLGPRPESDEVWRASLAVAALHYLVSRVLQKRGRTAWQLAPMSMHAAAATANCKTVEC